MIDVKYKPTIKAIFVTLAIAGAIWLINQTFWSLIYYLSPQFLLGLKPVVYLIGIWKAYKWSSNEFEQQFPNE